MLGFDWSAFSLSALEAKAKALTSEVEATASAWWDELQRLVANQDALRIEEERSAGLVEPDRSEALRKINALRQTSSGVVDSVLSVLPDSIRAKIRGPRLVEGLGVVPLIPLAVLGAVAVLGVGWMTSSIAKMKETSARIEAFRSGGAKAAEAVAPASGSLLSVGGSLATWSYVAIPAAGLVGLVAWFSLRNRKGKR